MFVMLCYYVYILGFFSPHLLKMESKCFDQQEELESLEEKLSNRDEEIKSLQWQLTKEQEKVCLYLCVCMCACVCACVRTDTNETPFSPLHL